MVRPRPRGRFRLPAPQIHVTAAPQAGEKVQWHLRLGMISSLTARAIRLLPIRRPYTQERQEPLMGVIRFFASCGRQTGKRSV